MSNPHPKIEPASPMFAVIRLDDRGTPFVDGICVDYDMGGVKRRLDEIEALAPSYRTSSPIMTGPKGEFFAMVEIRFIKWMGDRE